MHVKSGKVCAMAGEGTVDNDIEHLKGSGWVCYIPRVNNPVATYGNSRPAWVVLLGAYLSHYFLYVIPFLLFAGTFSY